MFDFSLEQWVVIALFVAMVVFFLSNMSIRKDKGSGNNQQS